MPERVFLLIAVVAVVVVATVVIRAWNARRVQSLMASDGKPNWDALGEQPDGRPAVITFSTPSCSACATAQAPAVAAVTRQADVRVIKIDASTRPDVARAFGVLTVPSTVVLAARGHVVAVNQGFAPTVKLVEQLQRA